MATAGHNWAGVAQARFHEHADTPAAIASTFQR
jgi:hypothetical protein